MASLLSFDSRSDCISLIAEMKVGDYLETVDRAYLNRGGIKNQRSPLKTTSARRIRQRMKEDIAQGALIPPVVIGLVVEEQTFAEWKKVVAGDELFTQITETASPDKFSIIDGMQRTTSLREVVEEDGEVRARTLRVEFWISCDESALIYRMLVLNAGQIPWDVKKQISVVFEPLIEEAKKETSASRIIEYGQGRRFNPGEYSSSDVAEMYISFSSRKLSTDNQEVLTDEFTKLDIVEALSRYKFREYFFQALEILINLDHTISSYTEEGDAKRTVGRQLFDKQAARVGLIVAIAISVFGRAGAERSENDVQSNLGLIAEQVRSFCAAFSRMDQEQKREFLKFDILNEALARKSAQVGRYERNLFFEAFRVLIEEKFLVRDMEVCWRAPL